MRQCQLDAYLKQETARVIEHQIDASGHHWVQLDSSIFYAEAGGQPADSGWIGAVRIQDVQRRDGQVWHKVSEKPESGGQTVKVDWARRFDHMQQHSGQHMLTALILERFGWSTLGFQLGSSFSTIELDTARIDPAERLEIETMANRCILENRTIKFKLVQRSDIQSLGVRSRGLPEYVDGPIRLIEIEGLDLNTCGGTHVSGTAELQVCKILGMDSIRGRTRLQFIFGVRVTQSYEEMFHREMALNQVFGQGPGVHAELAAKVIAERKNQSKHISALQERLASALAKEVVPESGLVIRNVVGGLDFCTLFARSVVELHPQATVMVTGEDAFVICDPSGWAQKNRDIILSTLEGRGGGRPPWMQGKCAAPRSISSLAAFYHQKPGAS